MLKVVKKLPFWQRNIMAVPLTAEQIEQKYRRRCYRGVRMADRDVNGKVVEGTERTKGKTQKDHASGAWNQRFTRVSSELPSHKQHRGDVADG